MDNTTYESEPEKHAGSLRARADVLRESWAGGTRYAAGSALVVLSAAYGIKALDSAMVAMLEEPIKAEFAVSDTAMGLLSGLSFAFFYIALGIPLSRLADRYNRKNLVALSLLFFSGATFVSGFAPSFAFLLFARICVAIGEAALTPASTSILADYFPPERRQLPMAIFTVGGFLGGAFGMFAIMALGVSNNWRHVFIIAAVPGLMCVPAVWALVKEPQRARAKPSVRRTPVPLVVIELLRIRSYRNITLGFAMAMLVGYTSLSWFPAFLSRSLGFNQARVFLFVPLVWGVGGAVGALSSGALAARLRLAGPDRPLLLISLISILFAVAFSLGFVFPGAFFAFPVLVLAFILVGCSQGPVFALIQDLVPDDRRALSMGLLLFLATAVGMGIGPVAVGFLSDTLRPWLEAESLRWSLATVISVSGAVSAIAFYRASKSIRRDIAAVSKSA